MDNAQEDKKKKLTLSSKEINIVNYEYMDNDFVFTGRVIN